MNQEIHKAARILWDFHNVGDPIVISDLIVGLGSYDLRVVDRCVALLEDGMAPQLCFTGASGNWTSDLYDSSEAEAFAQRAIELGVSPERISVEVKARNIGENIAFVRNMFPDIERLIWVTKPQTQRRVRATLDLQLSELNAAVTSTGQSLDSQPTDSHTMHDLICEMVGDTWRIAAYPDLGFIVEQPIPKQVQNAFNSLVSAGFRDHLPDNIATLDDR